MARNKVLERAKVTMPSGRNAVDLSQEKSFAQYAADLNVCYCQPVAAGTKGKISRKCFTRTADVVSPAFHRVTEHFDFFIVPIHALWRYWDNWKVNINDMQDTNLVSFNSSTVRPDLALPSYVPRMDHANLISRLGYYLKNDGETYPPFMRGANDALRLLEQLNYGTMEDAIVASGGTTTVLNLLKLAAYQKCYFDHYRNTAYESNNPYAYNLDWLTADSQHNGILNPTAPADISTMETKDTYVARELLTMRRVNYRNDYYHNIYPSLNYVSTQFSSPNGLSWFVPSNIGGFASGHGLAQESINSNTPSGSVTILNGTNSFQVVGVNSSNISVQGIRSAFALDKLMRASAYAPKHVRDQYKALYGVDNVEDFDMKSQRIGSFQSDVLLTEVVNMAKTALSPLGDLGAKGVGGESKSRSFSYYAQYDSIIIGLHYFLPRARYDALGCDPWNVNIAREDFYIKAFENLGLRPMYLYALDNSSPSRSTLIGWSVPNFWLKIKPDLNEGPFKEFFAEVTDGNTDYDIDTQVTSQLSTFVPHTQNVFSFFNTAEFFKAAPEDLDNLFKVQVPGDHRISIYQFYGDFRISHAAVIPMSIHGQPSL